MGITPSISNNKILITPSNTAYQSAIIWVFPRGLALFDDTVLSLLVFALYWLPHGSPVSDQGCNNQSINTNAGSKMNSSKKAAAPAIQTTAHNAHGGCEGR